ncbi:MAG: hypothetical protein V4668_00275 [Patescibacteria group bacterium]
MTTPLIPPYASETKPSTAVRVLERIEQEAITPTPRWQFFVGEGILWLIWLGTVIFGSAALSVTAYVALSATYALYEATHENFVTFLIQSMPYLWLVLFSLMAYLTVFEVKKTKRGYRYGTFVILGSSLACTVIGSVLFHALGLGYVVDRTLGQQISMYMSMEKSERKMWQMPAKGRLLGEIHTPESGGENEVINFKDTTGALWRISDGEMTDKERALLLSGATVRLLGTTTSEFSFHVCGVFPWLQGKAMGRRELMQERQEFDDMLAVHRRMMEGNRPPNVPVESVCSHLEMMSRLQAR